MLKLLICSAAIPETIDDMIYHNSSAANHFIHNFTHELNMFSVKYFSYLSYKISPNEKKLICNSVVEKKEYQIYFRIANFFDYIKTQIALIKLINSSDIILTYNMNYVFWIIRLVSRVLHKKHAIIIADFTETKEYSNLIRKFYQSINWFLISQYRSVIVLSVLLKNKLKRAILFEGAINKNLFDKIKPPELQDQIICYYGGVLDYVTGTDKLLKIFDKLKNHNIKFVVTGKGELLDAVLDYDEKYNNFEYKGFVDFNEYIEILNKSHILLNPRNMDMPQNLNNFPSKIFDYMASGREIISTYFPNHENYESSISFVNNNIEDFIEKIELFNMQVMIDKYSSKRDVANNYFWESRITKLIEYIIQ